MMYPSSGAMIKCGNSTRFGTLVPSETVKTTICPYVISGHCLKLLMIVKPRWFPVEYAFILAAQVKLRWLPIFSSLDLGTGAVVAIVGVTLALATWISSNSSWTPATFSDRQPFVKSTFFSQAYQVFFNGG